MLPRRNHTVHSQSVRSYHVPAFLSTRIAWDGHDRMHNPHEIQFSISMRICPRIRSGYSTGSKGYWVVAGFFEEVLDHPSGKCKPFLSFPYCCSFLPSVPYSLRTDRSSGSGSVHPPADILSGSLPSEGYCLSSVYADGSGPDILFRCLLHNRLPRPLAARSA